MPEIRIDELGFRYARAREAALVGINLQVKPGEILGLAGANGAGKSTLIRLVLGQIRAASGHVAIDGISPRNYVEGRGVSYVPERIELPSHWRLSESLQRFAVLSGMSKRDGEEAVEEQIRIMELGQHRDKRISALSKGTLQRLALAQALVVPFKLVVFDEPTYGLDPEWVIRFRAIVRGLRATDRVTILASHNLDELERLANRVLILSGGRIAREIAPRSNSDSQSVLVEFSIVGLSDSQVFCHFPRAIRVDEGRYRVGELDIGDVSRRVAQLLSLGGVLKAFEVTGMRLEEHFASVLREKSSE